MSLECPRCGLFSPEEALRCDCGYDFATNTTHDSYLLNDRSYTKRVQESSDGAIRAGLLILGAALCITLASLAGGGNRYFLLGGILLGTRLVLSGIRNHPMESPQSSSRLRGRLPAAPILNLSQPTPVSKRPAETQATLEDGGGMWPPKDHRSPEAWDRYWRNMLQHGRTAIGFNDMMASDPELIGLLRARGTRTILCVGNGMSSEAVALALFGFEVTALDLSQIPAEVFGGVFRNPDSRLAKLPGLVVHDDGTVVFGDGTIDSDVCPPIHSAPGTAHTGGGTFVYVSGDMLDPTICAGPFDAIIERRTVQLFPAEDRLAALHGIEARLAANGAFVSHQHNGGWRPSEPRAHYAESWINERGFGRLMSGAATGSSAGRVARLVYTTG